ncbi:MAG: histidine phosphatase family protein [Patescibacteria group bacterium]
MKILFVRHGESEKNVQGVTHNQGDDSALTAAGRQQILALAVKLKKYQPAAVYCSNETRSRQSAEIIAKNFDIPVVVSEKIGERQLGEWAGKPWKEFEAELNKMDLKERYTFVPAGGESWQQMERRLSEFLDGLLKQKGGCYVVLTHGGAMRALIPLLEKGDLAKSFAYDFTNAEVLVADYHDGKFKLGKLE